MPCSKPVPTAASKRIFQLTTLAASMYLVFRTVYCSLAFQSAQRFAPAPLAVRLTVIGLRDAGRPPGVRNLAEVGLLLFQCRLPPGAVAWGNASATVTFPSPVDANGYYIRLNDGPQEEDPVRWIFETSPTGRDGDWSLRGASGWRSDGGDFYYFPGLRYAGDVPRNGTMVADMTPSWNWVLVWIVDNGFSALGWLAYAAVGVTGWHKVRIDPRGGRFESVSLRYSVHPSNCRVGGARDERCVLLCDAAWPSRPTEANAGPQIGLSIFAALFSFKSGIELFAAIGYSAEGSPREAVSTWLYLIPNALFALSLRAFERRTAHAILAYGALQVACSAARDLALFQESARILPDALAGLSFSALLVAAVVLAGRAVAVRRARAVVRGDRRGYDAVWERLLEDEPFARDVGVLKEEVLQMSRDSEEVTCRQLNRRKRADSPPASGPHRLIRSLSRGYGLGPMGRGKTPRVGSGACGEPWTVDPSRPVRSLDQLFFQASGLYHILLAKAQVAHSDSLPGGSKGWGALGIWGLGVAIPPRGL